LAVNHGRRHEAAYHWVAERIRSGEWGELRGMHVSCPGIGLGCLGTHFIDLMRFLSGEDMKCLTGFLDPERGPNPRGAAYHDPGGLLVAQGSNGTRFVLHQIEDGGGPHHIRLDLTGARVLIDERDRRMDVLRRVAPGKFEPDPLPAGRELRLDLLQICADILTELSNGGALTCTADNANRALEAILAGHLSHQAGNRPVSLPLTDPAHLDFEVAIT
jgi:predicted dehydrogenase